MLPEPWHAAGPELVPYLTDSFGNHTRIDYGTGHETNFAALLYCLARLGLILSEDRAGIVLKVFSRQDGCACDGFRWEPVPPLNRHRRRLAGTFP